MTCAIFPPASMMNVARCAPQYVLPYIDGDQITRRYQVAKPHRVLNLVQGFKFKPDSDYSDPKLLIRQAGVGILASYDQTGARVPQSVYWYRLKEAREAAGYRHEYVLAALLSRTMAYFVFKRFSEVDPARAHAKVTHSRLASLPIPSIDFSDPAQKKLHDDIADLAVTMLDGSAKLGGLEDMTIDRKLRQVWQLTGDQGLHINLELAQVPAGQVIRDMFPGGLPAQILSAANAHSDDLVAAVPVA